MFDKMEFKSLQEEPLVELLSLGVPDRAEVLPKLLPKSRIDRIRQSARPPCFKALLNLFAPRSHASLGLLIRWSWV